MADITVSKIYLFLAKQGNWKTDADRNKDETITKGEMREYLSGSKFEDFAECSITDVSAKVFNDFWNRLDKNVNNNKLDDTELNRAQGQILTVRYAKEYVEKSCTEAPSGIDKEAWQNAIVDALDGDIMKFLNTTTIFDNLPSFLESLDDNMKSAIEQGLAGALEAAKTTATIQCYIENYTKETENNAEIKALKDFGYTLSKDDDLKAIIAEWMKQNTETDPAKIKEAIKNLIEGYLKTANIGNGDIKVLEGNSVYKPAKLNELQMAKLKKEAQSVFGSSLKDKASSFSIEGINGPIDLTGGGYDGIYKKYVDEFLATYFESGYKNATRTDGQSLFDAALNELKTKGFELFQASKFGEKFITEIQFADNYRFAWESKDFFGEIVKTGIDGVGEDGNIIAGSDLDCLKTWLNNDCGEGKFPEYFEAYNKILNSLLNPYDNTYRKTNGSINYDKINSELLEVIKTKFGITTNASSVDNGNEQNNVETSINWSSFSGDDSKSTWNYVLFNGDALSNDAQVSNVSLKYFYENGGTTGRLSLLNGTWGAGYVKGDWLACVREAQTNMNYFVDLLSNVCKGTGNYDNAALEIAAQKVKNIYTTAFQHAAGPNYDGNGNHWAGKKSTRTNTIIAEDGSYSYTVKKWNSQSSAHCRNNEGGSLGLCIAEECDGKHDFQITVDPKVVMDLFAKFYTEALS